jgi:hypothetical protein
MADNEIQDALPGGTDYIAYWRWPIYSCLPSLVDDDDSGGPWAYATHEDPVGGLIPLVDASDIPGYAQKFAHPSGKFMTLYSGCDMYLLAEIGEVGNNLMLQLIEDGVGYVNNGPLTAEVFNNFTLDESGFNKSDCCPYHLECYPDQDATGHKCQWMYGEPDVENLCEEGAVCEPSTPVDDDCSGEQHCINHWQEVPTHLPHDLDPGDLGYTVSIGESRAQFESSCPGVPPPPYASYSVCCGDGSMNSSIQSVNCCGDPHVTTFFGEKYDM